MDSDIVTSLRTRKRQTLIAALEGVELDVRDRRMIEHYVTVWDEDTVVWLASLVDRVRELGDRE